MTFSQIDRIHLIASLEEFKEAKDKSFFCALNPSSIDSICDQCIYKLENWTVMTSFTMDEYDVMLGAVDRAACMMRAGIGMLPEGFEELLDRLDSIFDQSDK